MAINIPCLNTVLTPQGGVNAFTGSGMDYQFTLSLPTGGDGQVTIILTDINTGVQTQVGFGNVTGQVPVMVMTFNNKVYALAGGAVYMSAINSPTVWNDPNGIGNGYVILSNWFASTEDLVSMAPYQGRLVFFSRRTAQIWITDPDIQNWQIVQTLTNIGDLATLGPQSLGDLDVLFPSDTGIRSLRVRDNTLNAFVSDVGSPIDTLIQTALLAGNGSSSVGIVEPSANRYWLYLNGLIYVFSNFPSNKIMAWGTYLPTYDNGTAQTTFAVQTFTEFDGQVYARDTNAFYLYGGSDNNTYDNCVATIATSWLDTNTPGTWKSAKSLDTAFEGTWTFSVGMNQLVGTVNEVFTGSQPTFQLGQIPFSCDGFHFKMQAVSSETGYMRLSSLVLHYEKGQEK